MRSDVDFILGYLFYVRYYPPPKPWEYKGGDCLLLDRADGLPSHKGGKGAWLPCLGCVCHLQSTEMEFGTRYLVTYKFDAAVSQS